MDDAAFNLVWTPEKSVCLRDFSLKKKGPDPAATDRRSLPDDRRDRNDGKPEIPAEPDEVGDAALLPPPETEILSDHNLFYVEGFSQDLAGEFGFGQGGKGPIERHDDRRPNAGFLDSRQTLPERLDHGQAAATEDFFRVGGECQDRRTQILFPRDLNQAAEDFLMAQMKAIKIANRHGRWARAPAEIGQGSENPHRLQIAMIFDF